MVSDLSPAILNRINEIVTSKSEDNCSLILKYERIKNTQSDMKYLEKCSNSESCEKMCSSKERSKPGKRRMGYREQYRLRESAVKQVTRPWENMAVSV